MRLQVAVALSLALAAVDVAIPGLAGAVADMIVARLRAPDSDGPWGAPEYQVIALLVVCGVLRGLMTARRRHLLTRVGENVAARVREAQWRHHTRLPLAETEQRGAGRLLLRFTSDTRPLQRFISSVVVSLVGDIVRIALIVLAMLAINWRMALPVLVALVVYLAIFGQLNPRLQRAIRATRGRRAALSEYLNEHLVGMRVVKAFARERYESGRVKALSRDLADRATRQAAIAGRLEGMGAVVATLAIAAILIAAGVEVEAGRVSAGGLVAFISLSQLLWPSFSRITTADRHVQEAHVFVDRLRRTLRTRTERPGDSRRPKLVVTRGVVALEKVSCSYPGGLEALHRVSLTARPGRLVAVVGPSGAGKSTLLDVILGFVEPNGGRVRIDGQSLADVSMASLRSQIGLVGREAPLFAGTIRDNITLGRELGEEQIWHAAQLAGLVDVLAGLPDGLETEVGPGGARIPAGARPRIALARALAGDPPIILLDEIAASMDAESQRALAAVLRYLKQSKTVIVVTGARPVLAAADRVYVLDGGRVVASGVHRKLLRAEAAYMRLVRGTAARESPPRATA